MGRRKHKPRKPRTSNKIPAIAAASSSSASPEDAPSSSVLPPPPWIELPGDVTANILRRLGTAGMLESAQKVCTTWWKACQDPAMWRVIHLRNSAAPLDFCYNSMCRRAVDLGQGQLIDLSIERFGDKKLIDYIANRSSNLKRLTLRGCHFIYGNYLTQAVEKLPELEELHLTNMPSVGAEDVRAIGLACPKLKSFSYNGCGFKHPRIKGLYYGYSNESVDGYYTYSNESVDEPHPNDYALAISASMPNLHHLRLFAQWTSNRSLEAILDACPHLESLDLRQCYDLDLSGDLGRRCREQIKDLRLPSDSASDIQHLVGGPSDWADNSHDLYDDPLSDDYYCDYDDYDYDDYSIGNYFWGNGGIGGGLFF